MPASPISNRCRLVLIVSRQMSERLDGAAISSALNGGDVASIIVPAYDLGEKAYQSFLEEVVSLTQGRDIAVLGVDDVRCANRAGTDGVLMTGGQQVLSETLEQYDQKIIVGCGHVNSRDDALKRAELQPAFIFFGRLEKDIMAKPHAKNLDIATWWSQMVEIPCIIMGGNEVESVTDAASTGADFVALSHAVFGEGKDPGAMVERANALLEKFPLIEA